MAYMRGRYYIYVGGNLEIHANGEHVSLPMKVFDELVIMRMAEMTEAHKISVIKRTIREYTGNFGCDKLRKKCGLVTCFELLKKQFEESAKEKERAKEKEKVKKE
jgi:hypothetical protein